MKGIARAEEGLCLKTPEINFAQFHHLKSTYLKFLKRLKLFTSIQKEEKN